MATVLNGFASGTLVDADILSLVSAGQLIIEDFDEHSVKQACYELRASDVFWETWSSQEDKRVEVSSQVGYLLRPNRFVTVIVKEKIALPLNVLARILAKGQLVSIGVLPVNTYADPGFEGRLGITLFNGSRRYLSIRPGQAIAKIEFTVLPKPVERGYRGQHGYETQIWPIPTQHYADVDSLQRSKIIGNEIVELEHRYGPEISKLAEKVAYYERRVWLQLGVTIICFLILFYIAGEIAFAASVLTGVAANLLTAFVMNIYSERVR